MNRVQGLLVAVITGLTLICVGLIVAVARSNASGGSGRIQLENIRIFIFLTLKEMNPLNNSYNPLHQILLLEMESWLWRKRLN